MDSKEFAQILAAAREGDEAAATQLVRHYEPLIRSVARMRLRTSSLKRRFDSIDIYQSIVLDFLRLLKRGEFQLATPQDLANLLVTMACNNIMTKARRNYMEEQNLPVGFDVPDHAPAPPDQISDKDLAAMARARLTADEHRLFVARHAAAIVRVSGSPAANAVSNLIPTVCRAS
jgi:DNA-directed RNA polymerase specialized sigma24 family protein